MRRPMIPLAISVAILDLHTGLAHLETGAPLLATLGATAGCRHQRIQGADRGSAFISSVDHHILLPM